MDRRSDASAAVIDAATLDRIFDDGEEDVLGYFNPASLRYPGRETRTVAVALPTSVFDAVEREADLTGIRVEDLIETWVADKVGLAA